MHRSLCRHTVKYTGKGELEGERQPLSAPLPHHPESWLLVLFVVPHKKLLMRKSDYQDSLPLGWF